MDKRCLMFKTTSPKFSTSSQTLRLTYKYLFTISWEDQQKAAPTVTVRDLTHQSSFSCIMRGAERVFVIGFVKDPPVSQPIRFLWRLTRTHSQTHTLTRPGLSAVQLLKGATLQKREPTRSEKWESAQTAAVSQSNLYTSSSFLLWTQTPCQPSEAVLGLSPPEE